jgi:hypothetical protein
MVWLKSAILAFIFLTTANGTSNDDDDFPKCFDELDCIEGQCCISDIPGVEGFCLDCSITLAIHTGLCDVSTNPCPEKGQCCYDGVCQACIEQVQNVGCDPHHAEGLVNPKVRATFFSY